MTAGRVVIVGSSIGGVRAAQGLRATGFGGQIVVVGAETSMPYDKPPLSKLLLSGDVTPIDIQLVGSADLVDQDIELRLGVPAGELNVGRRRVVLVDGSELEYDALVIATGVRPRVIGAPDEPLVHTIRELADVARLREALAGGGPLVVVGGGFIGAEVAATAAAMGVETTIVEATDAPFSRVLGAEVGAIVRGLHVGRGVEVLAGTGVVGVESRGPSGGVVLLDDGRELTASAVVAGIGCTPNTEWLKGAGLSLIDGVTTDEFCRVRGAPGVHAIGDVARWFDVRTGEHRRTEHWTHAFQQAQLVAHNIAHPDDLRANTKAPYFWSDQHGVRIQMAGHREPGDVVDVLSCEAPIGSRQVALYSNAGAYTAGVVFGWPQLLPKLRRAWEDLASIEEVRRIVDAASV